MRIPPRLSEQTFAQVLREFEAVVGPSWVFASEQDADLYRDAYSPFWNEEEQEIKPSAAVAPDGVEQVQEIVRIANRYRVPLYPVSTGRNLGYGGSAPVLDGSVVLDLKRMNRVLEIDADKAYVLVEPGVSYFDLYRYIQERGLKLWIDCPDPGWGSLIGNALEHGVGYTVTPYRDHFDAHCGMEVVLPTGDLVRTGMGALPGARTWQQFKYGYGPMLDGMFSQSNYGIVTKMGFWLYPEPEALLTATVHVHKHDDVVPLMRTMARLMNSGQMNSSTVMSSAMLDSAWNDAELYELFERRERADVEKLDAIAAQGKLPFWSSLLQFYGPAKVVQAQLEHAKELFASIPGASFEDGVSLRFPLSPEQTEAVIDKQRIGVPSLAIFFVGARSELNPVPAQGHFSLSPVIPMTGEAVVESQKVLMKAFRELDAKPMYMVFPQSFHPRSLVILCLFAVAADVETNRRVRRGFRELIKLAAAHGWGEYRTHTAFMDDCAAVYSFNDHALRRLQETIKDALDPNGILSAGRYGIWPKDWRN